MIVVVLLIALATVGVAFGYWTDNVKINGTVQNGNLNAEWFMYGYSDTNCTYTMDSSKHTLTITGANAMPSSNAQNSGFWCEVMLGVKNSGTIPVKINAPVVNKTGPDYWTLYALPTTETIAAGALSTGYVQINFLVPASETANEGATSTLSLSIDAVQVNAP